MLAKSIKRRTEWMRVERRSRRGIDDLMALDDRMLADIGLTRGDVAHVARYGQLPMWASGSADGNQHSC